MSEETYVELVPDDIELVQASEIDGTIFAINDDDDDDGDGDDDDDEDLHSLNLYPNV
ncbi:hypothetical protein DAPPUDRAFT_279686 [Daphnia pulex]|uniref:Uncharacterized protein n=1 Tax=Daphnia pulex TaxID=6669 RepID=E9I7J4_DAPPU|nr:hypothetical protein DAPPUDRAFT_279686 [Daphnia pulex]|eukprot:EFX60036.1 hypothetical protein DAPPUDRAFT_279686 [Daphnia pulex]